MLGSSDYGAQVAAHFGLPYCFAHFITDGQGAAEALTLYRDSYQPSARHPDPHGALTVWALAAETEAAAERLYTSRAVWRPGRDRGLYAPLPSPEEATAFAPTEIERAKMQRQRERAIVGPADRVAKMLRDLATRHGVEEIAILTACHDSASRQRSYALIAEALRARSPAQSALLRAASP